MVKLDVPGTAAAKVSVLDDDKSTWSYCSNTALPPVSAKPMVGLCSSSSLLVDILAISRVYCWHHCGQEIIFCC